MLGPEHARVFADGGWDRDRILAELHARLQLPGSEIVRGAGGIAEGVPESLADATLPKFKPDGLLLAFAGGTRRAVLGHHRRLGERYGWQHAGDPQVRYRDDSTGDGHA